MRENVTKEGRDVHVHVEQVDHSQEKNTEANLCELSEIATEAIHVQ